VVESADKERKSEGRATAEKKKKKRSERGSSTPHCGADRGMEGSTEVRVQRYNRSTPLSVSRARSFAVRLASASLGLVIRHLTKVCICIRTYLPTYVVFLVQSDAGLSSWWLSSCGEGAVEQVNIRKQRYITMTFQQPNQKQPARKGVGIGEGRWSWHPKAGSPAKKRNARQNHDSRPKNRHTSLVPTCTIPFTTLLDISDMRDAHAFTLPSVVKLVLGGPGTRGRRPRLTALASLR
jgi:hypothetical protein